VCVKHGADTVMDLSTGGHLDEIRTAIIQASPVPIGTVPIYQALQETPKVKDLSIDIMLDVIERQAKQGVDYMTLHCGVVLQALPHIKGRITGIVSRGGSILAEWMIDNRKQNFLYTPYDEILDICAK